MMQKVLIAEDHESANISLQKTLEELGIDDVHYVFYCDDALAKIQKGKLDNHSYDLLITDLYFEEDHRVQKLISGMDLIAAAREVQPDLRVLVFSAESKPAVIETLFYQYNIDGYVRKARNDARELRLAISAILQNQRHFPRQLQQLVKVKNAYQFTEYDITIISLLADGMRQKDIPQYLHENKIRPSGLSSIEKRLNNMKNVLEFSKNEQLVAYCKDMGII